MNIPKYVEMYRKDLQLKNYSYNTIKNYSCQLKFTHVSTTVLQSMALPI